MDGLASVSGARSYLASLREQIGSFSAQQLADALTHLESVYREFPELELDDLFQGSIETFYSAAAGRPNGDAIPLLMYCVALDPSPLRIAVLLERIALTDEWRLLPEVIKALPADKLPRESVAPIIQKLHQLDRPDAITCLIGELSERVDWDSRESASSLEGVFSCLSKDASFFGPNPDGVLQIVRSARRRLRPISDNRAHATSREEWLRLAERLQIMASRPPARTHVSGINTKTSFTEFLRQWPCEIEFSSEGDDAGFIEEAYRAILLRQPGSGERDRYLDLLRNGGISRPEILRQLLASKEFDALERLLRIIWDGQILLAERPSDAGIPTLAWPPGLMPSTPGHTASQAPGQSGVSADETSAPAHNGTQRSALGPLDPALRVRNWVAGMGGLSATATRQARLEHFNSTVYGTVEGWLGDRMWQIIDIIGAILDQNGVRGHIAEFGVHHGLFLFLLNALRNDAEECFAIDIFDDQSGNRDRSGQGSLAVFLSHVETFMPSERSFFRIVQRDTTTFSSGEIRELFGKKGVKFFSVDAGHSAQHTRNDLRLVQEVLVPGGIVALDDYMSVHWPGVTEGFYRFIETDNRELKPFAYFQNKLFLTQASEHASWLAQFRATIQAKYRDEFRAARWKQVQIAGSDCLSFS